MWAWIRSLCLALSLAFTALPAWAAKHAFVLGNADYDALSDLQNTLHDATAYADAFGALGYEVTHFTDLTLDQTEEKFEQFLDRIRPGDEVVFVYSGHGWSDGGTNYLIPVDAPQQGRDRQLKRRSVALRNGVNGVLDAFEAAGATLVIAIVDACRNNPFEPLAGTRSSGMRRGLAPVKAATGTFVIYSAGEGQEALDRLPSDPPGAGLSVFSRAFIPYLRPGILLEDAISQAQVETAAMALDVDGHLQHPAYYDQTLGGTCLAGECQAAVPVAAPAPSACDTFYAEAKAANACFAYRAYLGQCPDHSFKPFAEAYLTTHCPETAAAEPATDEPKPKTDDAPDRAALLQGWAGGAQILSTRSHAPEPIKTGAYFDQDGRFLHIKRKQDSVTDFRVYDVADGYREIFDSASIKGPHHRYIWRPETYAQIARNGDLTLFDPATGAIRRQIPTRGDKRVTFWTDYDATRLAVLWETGTAKSPLVVVDLISAAVLADLDVPMKWADQNAYDFSPDGTRVLVTATEGHVHVIDIPTRRVAPIDVRAGLQDDYLGAVFFSATGEEILVPTGYSDAEMLVFDIDTGSYRRKMPDPGNLYFWPMVFHPKGSPDPHRFAGSRAGYVLVRERDLEVVSSFALKGVKWNYQTALNPRHRLFASVSPKAVLRVYDLDTGALLREVQVLNSKPVSATFTSDGRGVIVLGETGDLVTTELLLDNPSGRK